MDRCAKLVGGALLALLGTGAHAFVTPAAPTGFTAGTGGGWSYAPASAAAQLNSIMRGAGPSIAGAGETRAAYKLAPSAARVLAGRVIAGAIPGVGLALALAWAASNCFEQQGGSWVRTCGVTPPVQSDGFEYYAAFNGNNVTGYKTSKGTACEALMGWFSEGSPGRQYRVDQVLPSCKISESLNSGATWAVKTTVNYTQRAGSCPTGWYLTDQGCVQTPPPATVTPQVVEDELATKPLPATLPPGVPYPIELPTIFNPTETNPPQAQPLRVPQGNPQLIPNSDPQRWSQPAVRYTPSPTASEPWRMDATPENVTSESPTGMTGPESVGSGSPPGEPTEKELDLCEKNPDILACQKMDQPDAEDLPDKPIELTFTPDSGWGAENAQCPAARHISAGGHDVPIPFDLFCQYMGGIRPIVIAMAFLSAALIIVGFKGSD